MLFMIMKSDINKSVCILYVHLSSISLENFNDRSFIIPEILELIKLHTYKFGLVYNSDSVIARRLLTGSLKDQKMFIARKR